MNFSPQEESQVKKLMKW